jgi:AraC-like DNA-binding protein
VRELLARIGNIITLRRRLRKTVRWRAPLTMHPTRVDVEPADRVFLDRVRTAIETHLGDDGFGVERLASEVAQSRGNLHRKLRELIGESPSDLIRRMRLERAAQLLESDVGSVAEVAYAVGSRALRTSRTPSTRLYGVSARRPGATTRCPTVSARDTKAARESRNSD